MGLGRVPSLGQVLESGRPNRWLSISEWKDMLVSLEPLSFLRILHLLAFSAMRGISDEPQCQMKATHETIPSLKWRE